MVHLLAAKFKYLTVLLSIFALLQLQVGVVYAQAQNDEIAEQRAQRSQTQQSTASQNRPKEMATATKEVELTKTDIANSEFVYFLTMIGMTLYLMSLWRYKPMSTDMRIAMGAGVVMMAAEIVSFFNTKKNIDAGTYKLEVRSDGTVNNMQLDALKKQRESYEALKKYASLKIKMAMAGTAALGVAIVLAHMEGSRLRALQAACGSAVKDVNNSTPLPIATCRLGVFEDFSALGLNFETPKATTIKGAAQRDILASFTTKLGTCQAEYTKEAAAATKLSGGTASTEVVAQGALVTSLQGSCTKYLESMFVLNDKYEAVPFDPSKVTANGTNDSLNYASMFNLESETTLVSTSKIQKFLTSLTDLIVPRANASLAALGLGATVIAAVISISMKGYKWMDEFVLNPTHRAIIYKINAAGLGLVIMMTKKAEGQAQDNIDKIDDMIARLEKLQQMKVANLDSVHQSIGLAGQLLPQDFEGTRIAADGQKFPCPPAVGGSGKCESIEQGITNSNDIGSLGSVMGNIASLSGRVADGIAGQDSLSAGTIANIDQLASQSAIAQSAVRQIEKQINDQEKSSGKNPTNFSRQEEGVLARLNAGTNEALRGVGMSPQAAVAAFGGVMPTEEEKKSLAEQLKLETSSVASKGGANMNNVKAPAFDFSFGDDGFTEAVVEDDFNYSDDMYAKAFESNANSDSSGGTSQIVGNRDVSLFQVISVRYMKSGLPRLLQEIE